MLYANLSTEHKAEEDDEIEYEQMLNGKAERSALVKEIFKNNSRLKESLRRVRGSRKQEGRHKAEVLMF